MPELINLFVSPHAISQFQDRIASMEEVKARRFISAGILQATNRKLLEANDKHPKTLRVRTKHPFPFEFRAFCVFDEGRGHYVVTTIVRGDSNQTRKRKRKNNLGSSGDFDIS
ncbi:MAG TPA: hypothetical protein VEF04_01225 [Blastocatellia bacterium]|nr:hypothetical protein [Blastocatellia bacterium]